MRQWILFASGLALAVGASVAGFWALMRPFGPGEYRDLLRLDLGVGLVAAAGVGLVVAAAIGRAKRWRPIWTGDAFLVPPRFDAERANVLVVVAALLAGVLVSGVLAAFHSLQHLFGPLF